MTAVAVATTACDAQHRPQPIPIPSTPEIAQAADQASTSAGSGQAWLPYGNVDPVERPDVKVRATIVPGDQPMPAKPQSVTIEPKHGNVTLNFPSAPVRVVAKAVLGDVLNLPYTVAEGVNASITLVTPGPTAKKSLLGLFETSLKAADLALLRVAGGYEIQSTAAAKGIGPVGPDTVGFGTEVIQLKFVNAGEMRKLLDSVLPGVVSAADEAGNSITIVGTTGQRGSAHDLLKQFDVDWLRSMSFALYVPQRTDARLIVPELDKMINAPDAPTHGLVRLIAMDRLNGILAISSQPRYLDDVRRWVEILDREGESSQRRLFVYRVQNGRSRDLAKTLNAAFGNGGDSGSTGNPDPFAEPGQTGGPLGASMGSSRGQNASGTTTGQRSSNLAGGGPNQQQQGGGGGADQSSQGAGIEARITSDDTNNAVIVYSTPREYGVIEDALRRLDIPPAQVLIEAAITEVTLTDELRYGVQWQYNFGNSSIGYSEGATPTPTQISPGFSYFYSGNNITAALNALEQRTNVKVVSAPKLLVLNNQTAALQVGDEVPVSSGSAVSVQNPDAPIVNSIEYRDTGVILKVTPRVNAGGLVLLDVSQEVSEVLARPTTSTSTTQTSPSISTRRVATTIAVQDGQVIALGGLFKDSRSYGKNGIPILSRIPVVGGLFGTHDNSQTRTELIVLLKPHVLHTVDDGRAITEELRAKLRTLEPFRTKGQIP
jgi:general secretion pathway protein D